MNLFRNSMRLGAAVLFSLAATAPAAEPLEIDRGATGLRQSLRRLANPYRVLHVIAHPDDEDSATLTYLSRGLGADVTIASITRGESGANLITDDAFDRLGVLRTIEFRRAAQFYGARLRFTRFADFGYSKTLEETLRNWTREEVLGDLVRIVREERPHVIVVRWQGGPRDGHGHHQTAGLLGKEAYAAAADPQRFPDAGPAWQALKLYSNNRRETDEWTAAIDSGSYDAVLGMSYAEIAREGLRAHRSQAAGSAIAPRGPSVRYYKLEASQAGMAERETGFFDRLETALPDGVSEAVERATAAYRAEDFPAAAAALARGLDVTRDEPDSEQRRRRERLFETAIAQALGIEMEFLVEPRDRPAGPFASFRPYETIAVATPGETFEAAVRLAGPADGARISIQAPAGWKVEETAAGGYRITAADDVSASTVHWSRESVWDFLYRFDGQWGGALPSPPVTAEASFEVDGVAVRLAAPLEASYIDTERVQRRRPLAVGPAVSVRFATPERIWPQGSGAFPVEVEMESRSGSALNGNVALETPPGWNSEPAAVPFRFERYGERRRAVFTVTPRADADGREAVRATASYGGHRSSASFEAIEWPGLETAWVSEPSEQYVRAMPLEVAPGLRVGYIMGAGDKVPEAVAQLGAELTLLDEAALASADLSVYDTILVGIRAYAVRPDLIAHNARLLAYVEQGGALIVQYNTPEFDRNFGPYPYKMTSRPEETSEEDAPVRILAPDNPVFAWPNRIGAADFDGWVEQRGSKFLVEWDERYEPLIETHDQGQDPQEGVWLSARSGKGIYVYCALAWYRQLPYAVPGAVRMFANLISLGAPDAPWREQ